MSVKEHIFVLQKQIYVHARSFLLTASSLRYISSDYRKILCFPLQNERISYYTIRTRFFIEFIFILKKNACIQCDKEDVQYVDG